jgi:hypothetical protein
MKILLQAVDEQAERERTKVYSHEETTRERTAHAPEKVSIFHTELKYAKYLLLQLLPLLCQMFTEKNGLVLSTVYEKDVPWITLQSVYYFF